MRNVGLLVAIAALIAACGSTEPSATAEPSGTIPSSTPTLEASAAGPSESAPGDTVWLCRPGLANDPCAGDLSATSVAANGQATIVPAEPAQDPPIDCFYVYPTVSRQSGVNATLAIDPEEIAVAKAQAALFSKVCNVYAPMYPQLTLAAIATPGKIDLAAALKAYEGVRSAFRDYLAHYNHGRGIVFIGHSQGAFMLTALIRGDVDPVPEIRKLLVSALLIGGNVTIATGQTKGGDFANIPACGTAAQTGCVVAYSSFSSTPAPDAYFGRPASPLDPLRTSAAGLQVLCVNPAAPGGGPAALFPYFPASGFDALLGGVKRSPWPSVKTPFVTLPAEYSAQCRTADGATYLEVTRTGGATDIRPSLPVTERPQWGLHVLDVNLALGNLVGLVAGESATYTS
jgi:hypothetical protein